MLSITKKLKKLFLSKNMQCKDKVIGFFSGAALNFFLPIETS
jgi:hypothetical protein